MKKFVFLLVIAMALLMVSCGNESVSENEGVTSSVSGEIESESSEQSGSAVDIHNLAPEDEVSIIGQRASSTLVNGNTMWVQVQQPDKTFVVYHCQMKDEFISAADEVKLAEVVKVRGLFLSLTDLERENTAILVTLYDCEIIE